MERMGFMEWLHGQAVQDVTQDQPFADLYAIGPLLQKVIGLEDPSVRKIKGALDAEFDDPNRTSHYLGQLVEAMAVWRTDTIFVDEKASMVPVPSPDAPLLGVVPPIRCGYRGVDGTDCENVAVAGSVRCMRHGGAITDPEVRSSLLLLAYARLVENTDVAVEALVDVAQNSRTDMARVQAAKELLDRAGIANNDQHVHLHGTVVTDEDDRSDELLARIRRDMDATRQRLRLVAIPAASEDTTEVG
jgi:hypothetical protein